MVVWFWPVLDCIWPDYFVYLVRLSRLSRVFISSIFRFKNLIFNFKNFDFYLRFFTFCFYRLGMVLLFRFGLSWWILTASGIIGMTSFSHFVFWFVFFLRVRYVELPFVILRVGVFALLFDEGSGDWRTECFPLFLAFVRRAFFSPVGIFGLMVVGSMVG